MDGLREPTAGLFEILWTRSVWGGDCARIDEFIRRTFEKDKNDGGNNMDLGVGSKIVMCSEIISGIAMVWINDIE